MSSDITIKARDLSKCYQIYRTPADRLKQMFVRWKPLYSTFWALQDCSFEIRKGETVGIIGRNGAGKSTLLQLISGVIQPSGGEIAVNGRVAALLELGAGFNPEFSGHENIRLYATLLGLSKAEVDARYDAIMDFAEITPFLDRPVKTYSTGMQARLAMAVAVNVSPEVLIIDEALSVGDEAFQRKCYARLEQVKQDGATILFVSHSATTVVDLCDWAMLIDHGQRLITGAPKTVVGQYHRLLYAPVEDLPKLRAEICALDGMASAAIDISPGPAATASSSPSQAALVEGEEWNDPNFISSSAIDYADQGAEISDMRLETEDQRAVNMVLHGKRYYLKYRVTFSEPQSRVRFGCMLKALDGVELGGKVSHRAGEEMAEIEAGTSITVSFPFTLSVVPGTYFFNAGVQAWQDAGHGYLARKVDGLMIRVQPAEGVLATGFNDFALGEGATVVLENSET